MVLKQKKYSVPSGTTFRTGSHSYRNKYLKQATMVKTLKYAECDDVCPENEFQPGVEYSLNKKGRWNLPKQIREEFHDCDENVSLQQFHKIKRRAKCVSYETNNGPVRKVVPKKYYFDGKSVEQSLTKAAEEDFERLEVGKSGDLKKPVEVTYSLYLPAGSRSAITYNPKYINVPVYANADEEHIQTAISKKGRISKQRLRINPSSYDDWSTIDESELPSDKDWPSELPSEKDWPNGAGLSSYEESVTYAEETRASDWGLEDGFGGFIELALQKKELEKYEKIKQEAKIRP